ncbi:MAG: adenylate/guanylate cyclase domain-containing protein, partial [Casimicrobiaceae bacterium]
MQPATRRLVAILVADVVGFSRLMERDDAGTLARLREIREGVFDPAIHANGGRVVKTAGDGMLVEFGSADASLRCAVDVQRAMAQRNRLGAAADRIEYRIGINIGDIIVEGNDIFGDGVNVAARLEALAEPGGICVSGAVRDQVHGSLDVQFVDAGEQQVKNIARPIRIFSVALSPPPSPGSPAAAPDGARAHAAQVSAAATGRRPSDRRSLWIASVVVLGGAALSAVWWNARTMPPPAPPAVSVAVMPLVAAAGNAATSQSAEPLTRELTAMLARSGTLVRVVPVSQAQAKAAGGGVGATARTLNVRYLAEGEVRQGQDATVVDLRLLDGATGA